MKSYPYYVVDVFSDVRYKGNPLAVVHTDTDLDIASYADIAREFGYSETSFIYYSQKDKALKVRSFTPTGVEVGGAGHNLLGAVAVALLIKLDIFTEQQGQQFVLIKDDVIGLSVDQSQPNAPLVGMHQNPARIEASVPAEDVARALSLDTEHVLFEDLYPAVVSTETTHLMVPLKDAAALAAAKVEKQLLIKIAEQYGFEGFYCYTILKNDPHYLAHTRFFNPGIGIDEDPATGSAAGPLAGYLLQKGYVKAGKDYKILQGEQIGRPSVIQFNAGHDGTWISGPAVIVMEGKIHI
ncbi:PhzF family phenazine biosynthesis protein [Dyadobacter sp. CY261]|uniref:PhzF family phenazine biosynthesis protein n=1 Tax=Dyadobacter sp. CY261 TaxID=2907203 RepID=UPI001F43545B|nr:PhzF family phenazine biosynthesis protein [Dyadobacter sp. CY261]MCF0074904.1 PhzF family phenazine biosynthesis protein [Dyadobacter sp. CY261]